MTTLQKIWEPCKEAFAHFLTLFAPTAEGKEKYLQQVLEGSFFLFHFVLFHFVLFHLVLFYRRMMFWFWFSGSQDLQPNQVRLLAFLGRRDRRRVDRHCDACASHHRRRGSGHDSRSHVHAL